MKHTEHTSHFYICQKIDDDVRFQPKKSSDHGCVLSRKIIDIQLLQTSTEYNLG